jgi:hypothetical protein
MRERSVLPTVLPNVVPTALPTVVPTVPPPVLPTVVPTVVPIVLPTVVPTTSRYFMLKFLHHHSLCFNSWSTLPSKRSKATQLYPFFFSIPLMFSALPDILLLIQTLISVCIADWWHSDKSKEKCILLEGGDDKQIMVLVVTHTHTWEANTK